MVRMREAVLKGACIIIKIVKVQITMYKRSKLQGYIVQPREYSQYFISGG